MQRTKYVKITYTNKTTDKRTKYDKYNIIYTNTHTPLTKNLLDVNDHDLTIWLVRCITPEAMGAQSFGTPGPTTYYL